MRFVLRGSRISDTHFPLRQRVPRYLPPRTTPGVAGDDGVVGADVDEEVTTLGICIGGGGGGGTAGTLLLLPSMMNKK
jgi:hypothetical protein